MFDYACHGDVSNQLRICDLFHFIAPNPYTTDEAITKLLRTRILNEGETDVGLLARFLTHYVPEFYNLPLEQRLGALKQVLKTNISAPMIRLFAAEDGLITRETIGTPLVHDNGLFLLHFVAETFGERWLQEWCGDLRQLIREVITVSRVDELHSTRCFKFPTGLAGWKGTPLLSLFYGHAQRGFSHEVWTPCVPGTYTWRTCLDSLLRAWLEELQTCGVDILEYGERELEMIFRNKAELKCLFNISWAYHQCGHLPLELEAVEIGPRVVDWVIRWELDQALIFGEFWDCVCANETDGLATVTSCSSHVPGAWVD